jgi:hypothetical protein
MLLHIPLVIALAVIAFCMKRKGSLKPSHGLACGALGFYLADTGFAASLHTAGADLLSMIGQVGV